MKKKYFLLLMLLSGLFCNKSFAQTFAIDGGIDSIISPNQTTCVDTYAVAVRIKNYGTTALTSIHIDYSVNGGPLLIFPWVGNLNYGDTLTVWIGNVVMNNFGNYNFDFFTTSPNSTSDQNTLNDAMSISRTIFNTIQVNIGNDHFICAGDSVQLSSQGGFASYSWNTNENTPSIYASIAGNYVLTVTDAIGCTDKDTAIVYEKDGNSLVGIMVSYYNGEFAVSFADYNEDGFLDIFNVLPTTPYPLTFLGDSLSHVTHITPQNFAAGTIASWADKDNDGDEDILMGTTSGTYIFRNDSGVYVQMQNSVFAFQETSQDSRGAAWVDLNNDGLLEMVLSGMSVTRVKSTSTNYGGSYNTDTILPNAYSVSTVDIDNDGDMDLLLTSGSVHEYINNGSGHFSDPGNNGLNYNFSSTYSTSCGDFDNDGDLDVYVATSTSNTVNHLLRNNSNGTFTDLTTAGDLVTDIGSAYGSVWVDYDNDGYLDIYTTVDQVATGDPFYKVYHNNGNGTFTSINPLSLGMTPNYYSVMSGIGTAVADFDNDGDMDVYFAAATAGSGSLFVNKGTCNNWLTLKLQGTLSNRSAIGARVYAYVTLNSIPQVLTQEITTQSGNRSESDRRVHFGLDNQTVVDSIVIHWPSGIVQELYSVPSNQFLTVVEQCNVLCNGTVFPGNANNDSIVDAADILPVGLFYNQIGSARMAIDNQWAPHQSQNWNVQQTNGQDLKHVDCNGDGTINANDTLAIQLNFGQVEYFPMAPHPTGIETRSGIPIYINFSAPAYAPGAWVDADIVIGDSTIGASSMFGFALQTSIPSAYVDPGTMSISRINSWLIASPTLGLGITHADSIGNSEIGLTRINHSNANGFGVVGKLRFRIPATITQPAVVPITFVSDTAILSNGNGIAISNQSSSFIVDPFLSVNEISNTENSLFVYPSPASGTCSVLFSQNESSVVTVEIIDVLGQVVYSENFGKFGNGNHEIELSVNGIKDGVYRIRLLNENSERTANLIVQNH